MGVQHSFEPTLRRVRACFRPEAPPETKWTTGQSLRRDGRVSLCVDEDHPPYAYVRVDGTTTILDDPELLRTWATRIAGRYMGAELAAQYGERNAVPGELLVRITPATIVAQADVAG